MHKIYNKYAIQNIKKLQNWLKNGQDTCLSTSLFHIPSCHCDSVYQNQLCSILYTGVIFSSVMVGYLEQQMLWNLSKSYIFEYTFTLLLSQRSRHTAIKKMVVIWSRSPSLCGISGKHLFYCVLFEVAWNKLNAVCFFDQVDHAVPLFRSFTILKQRGL